MQIQNNPVFFWLGLVILLVGVVTAFLYLVGPHVAFFGPGIRVKHGIVCLIVAVAGAVLASFSRPRPATS
jgi:hypothetical protein